MIKSSLYFICSLLFIVSLSGCNVTPDENTFPIEEELGAYSFGLLDVEMDDLIQFEYNGEELQIPYHVEGHGENSVSEFSWFALVDGLPQPTRLETFDGEVLSELAFMHEFSLEFRERHEFYVAFTPISGKVGDQVGFIGGALLRPNFMPESIEDPTFGIFHSLAATIPAEIDINFPINSRHSGYFDTQLKEIPKNVLEHEATFLTENEELETFLKQWPRMGLTPYGEEIQLDYEGLISIHDGYARLQLFLYGGQDVINRVTLFVNHLPVQVNGADFIEVQMKEGKIAILELELELEGVTSLNTLYAIAMPTGNDYHLQDIIKTRTLLLVDDNEVNR
jgi:hypothetical protein